MGKRNANSRPRAEGGGRSARYDERRRARGSKTQYAAEWSDAAAAVVLQQLQNVCKALGDNMLTQEHTEGAAERRGRAKLPA